MAFGRLIYYLPTFWEHCNEALCETLTSRLDVLLVSVDSDIVLKMEAVCQLGRTLDWLAELPPSSCQSESDMSFCPEVSLYTFFWH